MPGPFAAHPVTTAIKFVLKWVVVGLAAAFILVLLRPQWLGLAPRDAAPPAAPVPASFASAVERAAPAVVNIFTARLVTEPPGSAAPGQSDRRGELRQALETGLGSGVIVDSGGYLITNNHVINCAQQIFVQLADGRIEEAKVVGTDPATDIALLQINLKNPPTVPLGQSDTLRTGDIVLAIGTPYGLSQTVTQGIVSAIGRGQLGVSAIEGFIQTDAAINEGNSGGALINAQGELIGINTAALARSAGVNGISFAVPVNLVRGVMEAIRQDGRVIRGWFGVESEALSAQQAAILGVDPNLGMRIKRVYPDSPAAAAGLAENDIVTRINGAPRTLNEALSLVASTPPGEAITLTVLRQNTLYEFTVTLAERKPEDGLAASNNCASVSQ